MELILIVKESKGFLLVIPALGFRFKDLLIFHQCSVCVCYVYTYYMCLYIIYIHIYTYIGINQRLIPNLVWIRH